MYEEPARDAALALLESETISEVSRQTGISRSTLRSWLTAPRHVSGCPRCGQTDLAASAYSALLGFYLGDGCVSHHARHWTLRISCDGAYPGVILDVEGVMRSVRPDGRTSRVQAPGVIVVHATWKHWPCLFPQHGPGRKHERPIVLEDWQRRIVEAHPGPFLRGLFHSDGSRVRNWATRTVRGETRRYDYPRWQFTNVSADIQGLCCWALDLVEIPWRRSNAKTISVSTRAGVARLDELIGPKR